MNLEIRIVKENLIQITTLDERWYYEEEKILTIDKQSEIVERIFYPSSSWICSYYPKGIEYMKWLASKGWDEAERLMNEAGDRGTNVHKAIDSLLDGNPIKMTDKFFSEKTGKDEEIKVKEWEAIMSFADFISIAKPMIIKKEWSLINKQDGYGGTIDLVCIIPEDVKVGTSTITRGVYVIDYKTSKEIYPSSELQISSYKHAIPEETLDFIKNSLTEEQKKDKEFDEVKIAILQVGYNLNKRKWKFTECQDKYELFLSTRKTWENENKDKQPAQKDYPIEIKLDVKTLEITKTQAL